MEKIACLCKNEKELTRLATENIEQEKKIDERVKWSMFWAILLVLFGVMSAVVSNIYSQLDEIHTEVASNSAKLEQRLNDTALAQAKIDVQYVEIQKTLAEIKTQIAKFK